MRLLAKAALLVLGGACTLTAPAFAQTAEKPSLTLGVGGKPLLYYLPVTVAERKGFFKDEGLDVTITDFGGGAKSLLALIDGSIDAVAGAYEHTIHAQAKGEDIVATIELGRFYIAAAKASKPTYSVDGIIPESGMKNALAMLVAFDPELKNAKIDLARTFDGRFQKVSAETVK